MPGIGWRVSLSIIAFFGWLIFIVLWLFFYASSFTIYQNLAVILVSILVFFAVMGSSWAFWGMKYGPEMHSRTERRIVKRRARKRR